MKIKWTASASADLVRLHNFLAAVAPDAAARIVNQLGHAPDRLEAFPRLGEKLDNYEPHEVRRIIVGHYEMRHEIAEGEILILRIWHSRENRA
ncbi:type II toxin-antitoxin system RelE/ParE family toxin [Sphingobium boeckii]|uniref:Plasmid stabilization system protein ParE n=1 Tax=Sphingobium boeckii TaxID=1082345 RepID=A0A7W9AI80_9SPHN|nr:type II toxin-antitoxin system RelE/ParE family toxin [Sphingobium boeckii]MBB5686167.1 plasmid stabilization system protein ParE [Sphingobium boeckii]